MEVQNLEVEAQGSRPGEAQCSELGCGQSALEETPQGCGILAELAPSAVPGWGWGAGSMQVLGSCSYTLLEGRYALHLTDASRALRKQPIDEGTVPRSTTKRETQQKEGCSKPSL